MILSAQGGRRNFYDTLGVSRSADDKEIKRSFRKLAREWHPDVNKSPEAQKKFQEIARAYEVLSDGQRRSRYDQFGEAGVQGATSGGPDLSSLNLEDILGDVFGSFFGGGAGGNGSRGGQPVQRGPRRGADLQIEIDFEFNLACFGGEKTVQVRREEKCKTCVGSGVMSSGTATTCRQCDGRGAVMQVMQTPLGVMQTQRACPVCEGSGLDPSAICLACRGKGTTSERTDVTVKVPAGLSNENQLRSRGEGDKGSMGGPPGDLYITPKVMPSKEFQRHNFDILSEQEVELYDAMLGTTITVGTIDGSEDIRIPRGTQPDTRMRLRGRGVPKLGRKNERGDHYVTIKVSVPQKLSVEQEQLIKQLRNTM